MMDQIFTGFVVLVFAAAVLLFEGLWLWWRDTHGGAARRLNKRLSMLAARGPGGEPLSILKERRLARAEGLHRLLGRMPGSERLDGLLLQAGLDWNVARLLAASIASTLAGALIVQATPFPPSVSVLLCIGCALLPLSLVVRARRQRLRRIEFQLPEAADFIARALRAGHSFTNVLNMAGLELPDPLAAEFRIAHAETNYGVALHDALHRLAQRVPLTDLRYLVIAVLIQRESGGNLAEILDSISHIIRERLKLLAQVRVLSAEGRLSAWILGILPFALAGVMSVANPRYISVLWTDPQGQRLVAYSLVMMAVGVAWLRRVVRIHI